MPNKGIYFSLENKKMKINIDKNLPSGISEKKTVYLHYFE